MTGRRRQLRYQLAPAPRRPRTGLPPVTGPMIAGPDTIWQRPASQPRRTALNPENSREHNSKGLKLHRSNLHT